MNMPTEQDNYISLNNLHNIASQFNTSTMRVISSLEPVSNKLTSLELYDELKHINKIALNCYNMLKLSFCLSEYRMVKEQKINYNRQSIAINEFLSQRLDTVKLMLSSTGYILKYELCDEIIILDFDERYLSIALFLIVANSCSTSPNGSTVSVGLKRTQNNAVITIIDEGDGIGNIELKAILDGLDNDYTEALDLSLPLANEIIVALGGTLMITSKLNEGTLITISLPIESKQPESLSLNSNTKRYLTNRYSDVHIIFSGICEPTFF